MSYHILFEGVGFVFSYSTHIRNAYVAGILLKIKKVKHACNNAKIRLIILKR